MTKPPRRYDVTMDRDSGKLPNAAELAVAAQQAASSVRARIAGAHTAGADHKR